jgi:hypothetical protein
MLRVFLSIALVAVVSSAGQAQDLPDEVAAAVKTAQAECTAGKVTTGKGFITRRDVNGDKEADFLVDYEHARCEEFVSLFCGTGGCLIQVFASIGDGKYVAVMDRNAYGVKFARRRGLPAMIQHLHGSHCGRSGGGSGCEAVTYWNGEAFTPAYPLR